MKHEQYHVRSQGPEQQADNTSRKTSIEQMVELVNGITLEDVLILSTALHQIGLLEKLEEGNILPAAKDPNPFHFEHDEEKHEQWWAEHPSEGETFIRDTEERIRALRYLYVGVLLGRLVPGLLPQKNKKADYSSRK